MNRRGMTFIEVVVVIVIVGIMTLIAVEGVSSYQIQEVRAASKQLLGSLQRVRFNAMTKRSPALIASRGFGLQLVGIPASYIGYRHFEFNDCNNDFTYSTIGCAGGPEESAPVNGLTFPRAVSVTVDRNPPGDDDIIMYDELGVARSTAWAMGGRTYILTHNNSDITQRCVAVSTVRIREGVWNGATCL